MATDKCGCGGHEDQGSCASCHADDIFGYWCDTCSRSVPAKRCPYCGLKTQRKKDAKPPAKG